MEQIKIDALKSTFNFFAKDEQAIIKALENKDDFNTVMGIVESIDKTGSLEYRTQFIKVEDEKKNFLSANIFLKEHIIHNRLVNIIKKFTEEYNNIGIETFETVNGICNYKINLYDEKGKVKIVLNIIHPLINLYETLPPIA